MFKHLGKVGRGMGKVGRGREKEKGKREKKNGSPPKLDWKVGWAGLSSPNPNSKPNVQEQANFLHLSFSPVTHLPYLSTCLPTLP
jgi:hypothetical protein